MFDDSNNHNQIVNSLFDIASNIQIQPNFCIYHPNYQPFALPANIANRFQKNSSSLKQKYLNILLRNFIYGIYYNGSLQTTLAANNTHHHYQFQLNLSENNIGVYIYFYEQLHNSNYGVGYYDTNWQILSIEPDGSMSVKKDDLTIYIEPECHLKFPRKLSKSGEFISIWMPKNRLQNGYYVAVSNLGMAKEDRQNNDLELGRIYFNFTSAAAIIFMESLTKALNKAAICFSFHVLYNPAVYGRYDSGVLHFESQNYPTIRNILQEIYQEYHAYFQPEIPLFTKFLAPGLGLAEEPYQKFAPQESFGMNRCQIVANALLESWQKGKNAIEERIEIIHQHFAENLIDMHHPYLNPDSEDIYQPLS
ncbi:MAG: T3SS effector HopA1 family protein [Dolichospermum sp.]